MIFKHRWFWKVLQGILAKFHFSFREMSSADDAIFDVNVSIKFLFLSAKQKKN